VDVVFCGTPQFAVPSLEALLKNGFKVQLVVTQPDRPKGRGMEMAHSPLKQAALAHRLAVTQPEKIKTNAEFRAQLEALRPQAIVVVAYGKLVPQWMLDLPPLGNINVHGSLLPKYRGAAPIQWAVANGETVTGVTTMKLDVGMDTGPMLLKRELVIQPDDTAVSIAEPLAKLGAEALVETLRGLESGSIEPVAQNEQKATHARMLKKEDGRVAWQRSAQEIYNRWRGFQPWPGAFTSFRGVALKIVECRPVQDMTQPGELKIASGRVLVGCGEGALELLQVQPESRKAVSAQDFVSGMRVQAGERLG
jgi:methionyl-tRNA formyltransferase